jgi:hypothetical protein
MVIDNIIERLQKLEGLHINEMTLMEVIELTYELREFKLHLLYALLKDSFKDSSKKC